MLEKIQEILKSADFPTDILLIDFETYFDKEYSLSEMSVVEYVTDERFECLGMGVWESKTDTINWCEKPNVRDWFGLYTDRYGKNFEDVTLVVQNAFFDPLIMTQHFDIAPRHIIDIKHLDRHIESRASHKLGDMAVRHDLSNTKGDTKRFMGKHYRDIKGEPKYELFLMDYTINDVQLEKELLFLLLPQISRPEVELPLMNHTHRMYLYPSLQLNMPKARTLIPKMKIAMGKSTGDYDRNEISGDISFTKMMIEAMPEGESIPMKEGKPTKNMLPMTGPGLIPAFSKSDVQIDALKLHKCDEVRRLITARLALRSWPTHIKKLQNVIRQAKARNGWLGIPINYYGGHTGRFSGAEGINVQNFASRVDPLMGEIKECIEAPDGYTLILSDLSQIECRDLAYMSGQNDLLDIFVNRDDPYSEFATEVFKEEVRKPTKDDTQELYDRLYLRRYIGKQAVLGLGYGMGADRFFTQIQEYEIVRELVKNGEIKKKFAEDVVKLYRKIHTKVTNFWSEVEKNFKWVVRYPNEIRTMDCGLKFEKQDKTVRITLPSGRVKNYPHSSYRKDRGLRWQYGKLWGGTLCLSGETKVLTNQGVILLKNIQRHHKVWDGQQWVQHQGLKYNGVKPVLNINGIQMTPDHKIMTTGGWKNAGEAQGFTWKKVRIPDRYPKSRLLERHGINLQTRTHTRPNQQQWRLYSPKLQVGNLSRTSKKSAKFSKGKHSLDISANRDTTIYTILPEKTQPPTVDVYDLIDCGPQHCFTVLDSKNIPRLVHNCENIIQACSRDIFVEGLLTCWREGICPVMHVHDSLILCVKEDEAEDQLKQVEKIMTTNPSWCKGLPLEVESEINKFYR